MTTLALTLPPLLALATPFKGSGILVPMESTKKAGGEHQEE